MQIALFTENAIDSAGLIAALREYGLEITPCDLVSKSDPPIVADFCIMVSDQSLQPLAFGLSRIRKCLDPEVPLIACVAATHARDKLHQGGATYVIGPHDWEPQPLADRIMAQIFLEMPREEVSFHGYWGGVPAMRDLYRQIKSIAPFGEPVLIFGESGTGKELCALALHDQGARKGKLVPVNCGAISSDLVQSELFGHKKGSFSGAVTERKGLLAHASSGTLFLDEIGDLRHEDQVKLLRVIDEKKFRPIGANTPEEVDVRYVLATHRDLEQACHDGLFRNDLYQRIKATTLYLPPLRARKADLVLLARAFVAQFNDQYHRSVELGPEAHDCLFAYDWPGNVRELRGVIYHAAMFSEERGPLNLITLQRNINDLWRKHMARRPREQDIGSEYTIHFAPGDSWEQVEAKAFDALYKVALAKANGSKSKAADLMDIKRSTFYEKVKKYGDQEPARES